MSSDKEQHMEAPCTHDALRPWQRKAMVGKDGYDNGQQQVVLTLCGGAWHWWLSCWF